MQQCKLFSAPSNIYGCPEENWETIQETIDLICEIKPLSVIFYILDIFPGTRLYSEFKEKFNVTDDTNQCIK